MSMIAKKDMTDYNSIYRSPLKPHNTSNNNKQYCNFLHTDNSLEQRQNEELHESEK